MTCAATRSASNAVAGFAMRYFAPMSSIPAARRMRHRSRVWLRIGALLLVAVAAFGLNVVPTVRAQQAQRISGLVVAIADGDTLTLLDEGKHQHRIRVDGIDAPEKAQPFGDRSRQSLAALAHRREGKAECHKVDRYGRLVCKVFVDGVDVGLEQIRRGMAWHFRRYESEQTVADRSAYAAAEVQARQRQIGLWRDPDPIAPWDRRASKRADATTR